jgi:two-component system phosphate regulon response regulator OmpR
MTSDGAHILVIDDDARLRDLLKRYLSEQGFRVTTADDAADARKKLASIEFDLLVMDVMMPGETGLGLTRSLRQESKVPVLLLTAMAEAEDRIHGLELGADDYLTKPFEPRELVLRISAILRRVAESKSESPDQVRFGDFCFDLTRDELRCKDEFVRLTTAETSLLKALILRRGEAVSREELRAESTGMATERAIDVQVARLRRKIEANPKFPRYLQSVRGVGYSLLPD